MESPAGGVYDVSKGRDRRAVSCQRRHPVATAEQIKALLRSYAVGDEEHFRAVAMQIAATLARKGNSQLAEELRELIDKSRHHQGAVSSPRAVPIARPVGDLAGLVSASYPTTKMADMVLEAEVSHHLTEVVRQSRQRELLRSHGLSPKRKLLLVGPPGCGKTMSASAIAGECGLPLMFVQMHTLITKYMGETAAKLHLVFDSMSRTRGVYLFDEFDALGAERGLRNDVGEIRRVLNSFLQFLERDESESIIIAATNFVGMLDKALFRRFDDVIEYRRPTRRMAQSLVENRLSAFDLTGVEWGKLSSAFGNLSHAEIARACEDAARDSVLAARIDIGTSTLRQCLARRARMNVRQRVSGGRKK
jgi:SpoVK/Ycf46/Vps4 family AAA+-type ATPase